MKTKSDQYICYTLTVDKTRRYELINFFDETFFDVEYQIINDTVVEDLPQEYGELYDNVMTEFDEFSLRFYVTSADESATNKKLKGVPHGVFVESEPLVFSQEDALNAYKESFMLTDDCEIVFSKDARTDQATPIQIVLQPRNVFGTGSHQSTKLAARLLGKYTNKTDTLVDVGTGTGILAIYAAKRGIKTILAVDSDPLSITETQTNVRENDVMEAIEVQQNHFLTGIDTTRFTVIIANLSLHLYQQFLPEMTQKIKPKQKLLFSGVIEAERALFEVLLTDNDLTIKDKIIESGWVSYYVERNNEIRM